MKTLKQVWLFLVSFFRKTTAEKKPTDLQSLAGATCVASEATTLNLSNFYVERRKRYENFCVLLREQHLASGYYEIDESIFVTSEFVDGKETALWCISGVYPQIHAKFTKEFLDSHPEIFKWIEIKVVATEIN